eukprot:3173085-Amphidinium_carterae.1
MTSLLQLAEVHKADDVQDVFAGSQKTSLLPLAEEDNCAKDWLCSWLRLFDAAAPPLAFSMIL